METDSYSANQRRAINLVWTACGDYQFEPQFLALKADGTPDFYMNCVIGLVRKWLGDEMPRRLFALWADDTRRSAFDDLAWLALENAVYEKELPVRPVLAELRRAHAAEFFASEYQLSRQEWMDKNQLVYSLQSARWRSVLGQKPPLLAPWEKGLSEALACPGTLDADDLEAAVRAAFEKYLQFDGTPHKKSLFRLHFSDKWAPLLTKLLPVEIVRTDELTIGRSAVAGENGMVRASNALRAQLRSNEREAEDHDYIERCFGRSLYSPQALARIEQRCCTGDHLGCHLWFTRGERVSGQPMRADTQRLFEQAAEQAKRNRAAYVRDSALHQNALLRLTEQIRTQLLTMQPGAVSAEAVCYDKDGKPFSLGDSYIEVDFDNQQMTFIKDGRLVVNTNIVTGALNGHQTPTGLYETHGKEHDVWLKGDDYLVFVKYWVSVVGDIIGLHDASWRSNFGASFYVYGGSHGCVNTPEEAMALIWNLAEDGTPVLMHGANEWYEPANGNPRETKEPVRGTTSKVTVPNGTRVLEPGSSRIEIQPDDVVPFALPKEAGQDEDPPTNTTDTAKPVS